MMLAIVMVISGLPVIGGSSLIGVKVVEGAEIDLTSGEPYYTLTGGCSPVVWAPTDRKNLFKETDIEGVYSISFTAPAYDETAEWNSRVMICEYNEDTLQTWARILLGEPEISKKNNTDYAYDNITNIHILCEEETNVTAYFDSKTYAVVFRDEEGNNIPYTFGWLTRDSEENYYSPEEFCSFSFDEYKASLVNEERLNDINKLGITKLPNIVVLNNILNSKLDGTYVEPMEVTYHFYNAKGWDNVGAWVKQSIDWSEDCLPLDKCVLRDNSYDPIWPGAKMEYEGDGWYKITCTYTAPEKGSMMVFNNYVGDSTPNDVTTEADIQKLKEAGIILNDVLAKEQTQNIMIKKNGITSNEYWINWDGNSKGSQIIFGRSDMFTDVAPINYKPGQKCRLSANESSEDQTILKDEFLILEVQNLDEGNEEYTYKYVMEDVETGEIKVLKNYSTSTAYIHLLSTVGEKKFTVYSKDSTGYVTLSNSIIINVEEFSAELIVNRNSPNHKLIKGEYILLEPKVANESEDYLYKYVMEDVTTGEIKVLKDYSDSTRHIELLDSVGVKNFKVYVKSSQAEVVTNTVSIEVIEEEKLSATLKVNGSTDVLKISVGKELNITAEANGGSGSYEYKYALYNVNENKWTVLSDFTSEANYTHIINEYGIYHIALTVKDIEDDIVVSADRVLVEVEGKGMSLLGTLKVNDCTESLTVKTGDKLTLKVDATGGSGQYTYKYAMLNVNTGAWTILKDNSSDSDYVYQALTEGTYQFAVTLKDSEGDTIALSRVTVKVEKNDEPLKAVLSINGSSENITVNKGTKVTLKTNASGGKGSYTYKVAILNVDTGKWSVLRDFESSPEYTYSLDYSGTKQFAVTVKDGEGTTVAANRITVVVK